MNTDILQTARETEMEREGEKVAWGITDSESDLIFSEFFLPLKEVVFIHLQDCDTLYVI